MTLEEIRQSESCVGPHGPGATEGRRDTQNVYRENRVRGNVSNKILYTLIFRRTMRRGVCEIMYLRRGGNIYCFAGKTILSYNKQNVLILLITFTYYLINSISISIKFTIHFALSVECVKA